MAKTKRVPKIKKAGPLEDLQPEPMEKPDMSIRFKTGLTRLDAMLGGGYIPGIIDLPGDSDSGKTMMAATCMACAINNPETEHYKLYYNVTSESGINFPMEKLLGQKLADNIEFVKTQTVEDTVADIGKKCEAGAPFIYVVDSVDGLVSEAELGRVKDRIADRKVDNTYAMEKSKLLSTNLPTLKWLVKENKSLVLLIQQTRANVNASLYEKKVTKSGGKAAKFYADAEIWVYYKGKLMVETKINGKTQHVSIGTKAQMDVEKNHISGPTGKLEFTILLDHGIDDIGNIVDYLLTWGGLDMRGSWIACEDLFGRKYQKQDFINAVEEDDDAFDILAERVKTTMAKVLKDTVPTRKKRFN